MTKVQDTDLASLYSTAIIEAVTIVAEETKNPDINAAIAALTHAQAYLIAKIKDRNARRLAEKHAIEGLSSLVAAEVNARIISEQAGGKA